MPLLYDTWLKSYWYLNCYGQSFTKGDIVNKTINFWLQSGLKLTYNSVFRTFPIQLPADFSEL